MTEEEYKEALGRVSYITYLHPHLNRKDVLHDIIAVNDNTSSWQKRIDNYRNYLTRESRTTPVCCGGAEDVAHYVAYDSIHSPLITYKYCYHCNDVLPESEFRKTGPNSYARMCKRGEYANKKIHTTSRNKKKNDIKSKQKTRNNLSDSYIKDILRKNKMPITEENIIDKRASLLKKRKEKYLKNTVK